ncbi:MFS transporter [Microbacterium sediminicola]|uniref:MFS transporter n=1 Tax=Microbacterium sediminicola TaxID=415210 RepID=A0ABP4UIY6_9MICO
MSHPPARPLWQGRTLAVVGVIAVAFSLRSAVAALSPIVTHIDGDIGLPAAVVGLIGTVPPVCYAVFGILTPLMERKVGLERLLMLALVIMTLGQVVRVISPSALMLLLGTIVTFAGVGVANVLLPPIVKTYFSDRIGMMTAVSTTVMSISSFIPPLIAVPVSDAATWRLSLALWAGAAAVALVPWIVLAARAKAAHAGVQAASPAALGRMFRLPLAWGLVATFTATSSLAYTVFAWLPQILVDLAGVRAVEAGAMLSLFAVMGFPTAVLVPMVVARFGSRSLPALYVVGIVSGFLGLAGLGFAPSAAPWLWVGLLGAAPLFFPLTFVLLSLRTRTSSTSVALSGFVQSVGYGVAALFPLTIGILHEGTRSWDIALILLAVGVSFGIVGFFLVRGPQKIEDQWEARHGAW